MAAYMAAYIHSNLITINFPSQPLSQSCLHAIILQPNTFTAGGYTIFEHIIKRCARKSTL